MADCASMVESLRFSRRCFYNPLDRRGQPLVWFKISYTMPDGYERHETRMFRAWDELFDLPTGAVPMMTPVYALPFEGHPTACTQGMAFLIRTHDQEKDQPDVEARFMRKLNPHAPPDAIFEMPSDLREMNQYVFVMPIEDDYEPKG